jgi:serine/threonine-protein phosphatase PGAM5
MRIPNRLSSSTLVVALLTSLFATGGSLSAAESTGEEKPGARTLYLVRHGEYDHDDERDARTGKALVPLGIAQARVLGARLKAMPFEFTARLASPLTRARQTAEVIAAELPGPAFEIVDDLAECTPPTRRQDIMERESEEDLVACTEQLERLAERLLRPADSGDHRELVVCHGNVIRYLVTRALEVDPVAWLGMTVGNASLTIISFGADGHTRVTAVGDIGHLPPGLQSGLSGTPPRALVLPNP